MHAREYAADLASQAGTSGILHAACEKLHHEQRMHRSALHLQVYAICFLWPIQAWSHHADRRLPCVSPAHARMLPSDLCPAAANMA